MKYTSESTPQPLTYKLADRFKDTIIGPTKNHSTDADGNLIEWPEVLAENWNRNGERS